jgi:hypothetical protein
MTPKWNKAQKVPFAPYLSPPIAFIGCCYMSVE